MCGDELHQPQHIFYPDSLRFGREHCLQLVCRKLAECLKTLFLQRHITLHLVPRAILAVIDYGSSLAREEPQLTATQGLHKTFQSEITVRRGQPQHKGCIPLPLLQSRTALDEIGMNLYPAARCSDELLQFVFRLFRHTAQPEKGIEYPPLVVGQLDDKIVRLAFLDHIRRFHRKKPPFEVGCKDDIMPLVPDIQIGTLLAHRHRHVLVFALPEQHLVGVRQIGQIVRYRAPVGAVVVFGVPDGLAQPLEDTLVVLVHEIIAHREIGLRRDIERLAPPAAFGRGLFAG